MSHPGFSGPMLVMDKITGIRAFDLTSHGELESVGSSYKWKDGDHQASCKVNPSPHQVAASDCTCGFWAYYSPQEAGINPFASGRTVEGIIQGHGRVTAGSKGFRSEFGEIVAIVDPFGRDHSEYNDAIDNRKAVEKAKEEEEEEEKNKRFKFNFPYRPIGVAMWFIGIIGINAGFALSSNFETIGMWLASVSGVMLAASLAIFVYMIATSPPPTIPTSTSSSYGYSYMTTQESFDKMKERYPSVKIYASTGEARKAFPVSFRPESGSSKKNRKRFDPTEWLSEDTNY